MFKNFNGEELPPPAKRARDTFVNNIAKFYNGKGQEEKVRTDIEVKAIKATDGMDQILFPKYVSKDLIATELDEKVFQTKFIPLPFQISRVGPLASTNFTIWWDRSQRFISSSEISPKKPPSFPIKRFLSKFVAPVYVNELTSVPTTGITFPISTPETQTNRDLISADAIQAPNAAAYFENNADLLEFLLLLSKDMSCALTELLFLLPSVVNSDYIYADTVKAVLTGMQQPPITNLGFDLLTPPNEDFSFYRSNYNIGYVEDLERSTTSEKSQKTTFKNAVNIWLRAATSLKMLTSYWMPIYEHLQSIPNANTFLQEEYGEMNPELRAYNREIHDAAVRYKSRMEEYSSIYQTFSKTLHGFNENFLTQPTLTTTEWKAYLDYHQGVAPGTPLPTPLTAAFADHAVALLQRAANLEDEVRKLKEDNARIRKSKGSGTASGGGSMGGSTDKKALDDAARRLRESIISLQLRKVLQSWSPSIKFAFLVSGHLQLGSDRPLVLTSIDEILTEKILLNTEVTGHDNIFVTNLSGTDNMSEVRETIDRLINKEIEAFQDMFEVDKKDPEEGGELLLAPNLLMARERAWLFVLDLLMVAANNSINTGFGKCGVSTSNPTMRFLLFDVKGQNPSIFKAFARLTGAYLTEDQAVQQVKHTTKSDKDQDQGALQKAEMNMRKTLMMHGFKIQSNMYREYAQGLR